MTLGTPTTPPEVGPEEVGLNPDVGTLFGDDMILELLPADALTDLPSLLSYLDGLSETPPASITEGQVPAWRQLVGELEEAVEEGLVRPGEMARSLSWIEATSGVRLWHPSFIARDLPDWLMAWGVQSGNVNPLAAYPVAAPPPPSLIPTPSLVPPPPLLLAPPEITETPEEYAAWLAAQRKAAAPAAAPPAAAPAAVSVPVATAPPAVVTPTTIPAAATTTGTDEGSEIVRQVERTATPTRMAAPSLTPQIAQAISLGGALVEKDLKRIVAGVTTKVVREVRAVGVIAEQAKAQAAAAQKAAAAAPAVPTATIEHLVQSVDHLDSVVGKLQTLVADHGAAIKALQQPTTTPVPAKVMADIGNLDNIVGDLQHDQAADKADLSNQKAEIGKLLPLAPLVPALATLKPALVKKLPQTIQTEEDCCAENKAVTDPIAKAGGSASMLSNIAGLVTKVAALGILLSALDTLYAIFNLDATVAGTVRGAEWVTPYAVKAAGVALEDTTWAGTVHGAS